MITTTVVNQCDKVHGWILLTRADSVYSVFMFLRACGKGFDLVETENSYIASNVYDVAENFLKALEEAL